MFFRLTSERVIYDAICTTKRQKYVEGKYEIFDEPWTRHYLGDKQETDWVTVGAVFRPFLVQA